MISLSTLPKSTLDKMGEDGQNSLQRLAEPIAQVLGIRQEQIVALGEFKFNDKSFIVEVASEVDMAKLQVDPKALVSDPP
jgi:hypothetical protein